MTPNNEQRLSPYLTIHTRLLVRGKSIVAAFHPDQGQQVNITSLLNQKNLTDLATQVLHLQNVAPRVLAQQSLRRGLRKKKKTIT